MASCHEPGNGKPVCIQSDVITSLDRSYTDLRELMTVKLALFVERLETVEKKQDRILEGLEIGVIRPAQHSLGWEEDEDTGVHDAPTWATRAKGAAFELSSVRAENIRLQAIQDERNRISDRAQAKGKLSVDRWKVTATIIIAAIASVAAIAQAIVAAF
jgi:hypothetical protein